MNGAQKPHPKRSFNRFPIQRQFMIISVLSSLMIGTFTFLIFRTAPQILMTNVTNYVNLFTEKYSNQLDTLCFQVDVLCRQFQTDGFYRDLFEAKSYQDLAPETTLQLEDDVTYIKSMNACFADIAFVNQLIHWSTLFSEEDLSALYQQALESNISTSHGLGLKKSSFLSLADKDYYVYCCNVYNYGKHIGCVFVSLDMSKLDLDSYATDSPSSFFIMDTSGNVSGLSSNSPLFAEAVATTCQEYIGQLSGSSSPAPYTVNRDSFSIQMTYSDTANCYIISAVDIPSIREMLSDMTYYTWFLLVALVLSALLMMVSLYRNMVKPLNQISGIIEEMRSRKQRHLQHPLEVRGCAEVHDLAMAFYHMFSDIETLNEQIFETSSKLYEEKIRAQATQIDYFRSQINPHFLYNVLELIRSLALTYQAPEIASIAVAVGKIYRYSTKGNPIVPFREELEMTKAYIEIQKYRFHDKFDIFFNVPDEALEMPVIKIILQPLVENAIQHGIEPALEHCILYIGCTVTETEFTVEIRDDGVGMPAEKLEEMQTILTGSHYNADNYVGILNTNARLKLQYGEEYGITLNSRENDGTVVTLHMPNQSETSEKPQKTETASDHVRGLSGADAELE